jgi:hypothetical protein
MKSVDARYQKREPACPVVLISMTALRPSSASHGRALLFDILHCMSRLAMPAVHACWRGMPAEANLELNLFILNGLQPQSLAAVPLCSLSVV